MIPQKYLQFYKSLPLKFKNDLLFVIFILFASSILEVLTIIILKPIISALTNSGSININSPILDFSLFSNLVEINLESTIYFSIFLSTLSAITRISSLKMANMYAQNIGKYLADRSLTAILISTEESNRNYQSTDSITSLTSVNIDYAINSINSQLQLAAVIFNTFFLSLGLLIIEPFLTLFIIIGLGLFFLISALITKKRIKKNGEIIKDTISWCVKEVISLFQIRENIRINKEYIYKTKRFNSMYGKQRKAVHRNYLLSNSPRLFLDYFIFLIVPILALIFAFLNNQNSVFKSVLPSLILIGISMQRLLPSLTLIYRSWSRIKGFSPSLFKIIDLIRTTENLNLYPYKSSLTKQKSSKERIKEIIIKNLDFKISRNKYILKNCNYKIYSGDNICLIGESGSGKTTFIKILCGLLRPSSGKLLINGKSITKFASYNHNSSAILDIAYIPQSNKLIEGTILENIKFFSRNVGNIPKNLDEILDITLCNEFIKKLPNGINQLVGDSSSYQLSGGQIQRLAIASALCESPSMLIMDESTNALDVEKEKKIISNIIKYFNGIFVLITHRPNNCRLFNKVIVIKNNRVYEK